MLKVELLTRIRKTKLLVLQVQAQLEIKRKMILKQLVLQLQAILLVEITQLERKKAKKADVVKSRMMN